MGEPRTSNEEAMRRSEIARAGALAFVLWVTAPVRMYLRGTDAHFGEPIITDNQKPADAG